MINWCKCVYISYYNEWKRKRRGRGKVKERKIKKRARRVKEGGSRTISFLKILVFQSDSILL